MKRLFSILLCFSLILSLTSCIDNQYQMLGEVKTTPTPVPTTEETPIPWAEDPEPSESLGIFDRVPIIDITPTEPPEEEVEPTPSGPPVINGYANIFINGVRLSVPFKVNDILACGYNIVGAEIYSDTEVVLYALSLNSLIYLITSDPTPEQRALYQSDFMACTNDDAINWTVHALYFTAEQLNINADMELQTIEFLNGAQMGDSLVHIKELNGAFTTGVNEQANNRVVVTYVDDQASVEVHLRNAHSYYVSIKANSY